MNKPAIIQDEAPSTVAILAAVAKQNITAESVGVVERLVALKEREDGRQAERDFAVAFVALQSEIPRIEPTREIPDKHGNVKFKYAPYEEIMRAVRPLLLKHQFTVTFDNDFQDDRVVVTCKLQHIGGHKTETKHAARVGSGPVNASPAQADGAAQTYAKRFALCSALNIVIEHDTDATDRDARDDGDATYITAEESATLRSLCEETNTDKLKFLAHAGAKSFEEITRGSYDEKQLVALLEKRRK